MHELISTSRLIAEGQRLEGGQKFFARFPSGWAAVRREVLKLETRQEYREPGNHSWELLESGDEVGAIKALRAAREVDSPLYASLAQRGVKFIRCRPVRFPLTKYLGWELQCYAVNVEKGELVYLLREAQAEELFQSIALHDFVIFDDCLAFVHDYDERGEIVGGWEVTSSEAVAGLRRIFSVILELAVPMSEFHFSENA